MYSIAYILSKSKYVCMYILGKTRLHGNIYKRDNKEIYT